MARRDRRWRGAWRPIAAAALLGLAGGAQAAPTVEGAAAPIVDGAAGATLAALIPPGALRPYDPGRDGNAQLVRLVTEARRRAAARPGSAANCTGEAVSPGCLAAAAKVAAETLAAGGVRDLVLTDVAVAEAVSGDADGALATLAGLEAPAAVAAALVRVAEAAVEAGDDAAARRIAWALPGAEVRVRALLAVAVRALAEGDRGGCLIAAGDALAALPAIEAAERRALLLADIAVVEARAGRPGAAVSIVNLAFEELDTVPEEIAIARPLARLAAALAAAGRPRAAVDTLAAVPRGPERATALLATVGAEARTGRFAAAMVRTAAIPEARLRVAAFTRIARHQAESGDRTGAQSTLALARRALDGVVPAAWRARGLSRIALGYAAIDAIGPALVAARSIADRGLRARTLWVIAARAPDAADALRATARAIAARLADPVERTWLLGDLALADARAGETDALLAEAIATARGIAADWARARALARLAIVAARAARRPLEEGRR